MLFNYLSCPGFIHITVDHRTPTVNDFHEGLSVTHTNATGIREAESSILLLADGIKTVPYLSCSGRQAATPHAHNDPAPVHTTPFALRLIPLIIFTADAGVRLPKVSSPIIITGAREQQPRQATVSRVKRASAVVPPSDTPSSSTRALLTALTCLLYTSDAADEEDSVDLGG